MRMPPQSKYPPFPPVGLRDRRWPNQLITQAPVWLSTDLRDGNQALFEPMNAERKMHMFQMLCAMGFKEIEVGFPSASQTDFDFVRTLIEDGHIPDEVTISVLTQARPHLIERTMEALRGARRAIVHVYNATAPVFRDVVLGLSQNEVIELAVTSVQQIRALCAAQPATDWQLEYSPETFTATELPFAKAICDAVTAAWGATPSNKVILNLPATVEVTTPNVYADQIEWMHCHLDRRDSVVLSVHPHNDRGTAVAAAELAQMAGAERVEGCLFGNGERTGNVDLVTLALNLYTQGVDPQLDFANINAIARTVEECTQLPIHPRHPYVGDLVFTAFSGSHQDAIKKGFAAQKSDGVWQVPYLPIDPADLGRSYESIIRINSQSGKGGIAYLLETDYGLALPRRLQIEFSGVVQRHTDDTGAEVSAAELWQLFTHEYEQTRAPLAFLGYRLTDHGQSQSIRVQLNIDGEERILIGTGNGPIDALMHALQLPVQVLSYEEHSQGQGADAQATALVEVVHRNGGRGVYGVGIEGNIVTASIKAVVSAINRLLVNQADVGDMTGVLTQASETAQGG